MHYSKHIQYLLGLCRLQHGSSVLIAVILTAASSRQKRSLTFFHVLDDDDWVPAVVPQVGGQTISRRMVYRNHKKW
jgi:hypothetical protein